MTTREREPMDLGGLFSVCFEGGQIRQRELRLSQDEADYLARQYPTAVLTPIGVHTAEKNWFQVSLGDVFS